MLTPTIEPLIFSDGYRAAARWWRPEKPRGAVLYFHGIQSHGGWYEQSGARLAEAGLNVLMPDRRGSGLNQEQRGHVESVARCLADAYECLDHLLRDTGQESAHVVGVSWGGKLAVALAEAASEKVRSLTLIAPGLYPKVDLAKADKLRVALALLNDRDKCFEIPLNDPRLFTANPARIEYLKQDTLKLTHVTASFLLASRRLDRITHRFHRANWRGPLHLLLAGRDRIIRNEATRAWLKGLPCTNCRVTEYPDAEHTIEFETEAGRFPQDLIEWVVEHSPDR